MNIRLLYLYLFSFIGLLLVVIGAVQLVDLGLTVLVFPDSDNYGYYSARVETPIEDEMTAEEQADYEADNAAIDAANQTRQRQRQLITAISMIVVGAPLYGYHWRIIKSENRDQGI